MLTLDAPQFGCTFIIINQNAGKKIYELGSVALALVALQTRRGNRPGVEGAAQRRGAATMTRHSINAYDVRSELMLFIRGFTYPHFESVASTRHHGKPISLIVCT
jgi:hypothetical protein